MAESQNDQMQSALTCDTCEETAEHLCRTCHDRLCSRCKIVHSKSKASYDHEVVLLNSDAISLANEGIISFQQVCRKHVGSQMSICCGDCEIPICETCLLPEHSGHRVISISHLIKQKEPKVKAKYSKISSQLPKYENKLREIKRRREKIEESSRFLKAEIEMHFRSLQSKIEVKKTKLLKDVCEKNTAIIDKLKTHEDSFENYVKSMKTFMNDFKSKLPCESFILFGDCNVSASMPEYFPRIIFPELLQYERELNNEASLNSLCGRISVGNTHQNCTTRDFRLPCHRAKGSPLNASDLAQYPSSEQKQMLGEHLYPLISLMMSKLTGKITGMLLELNNAKLLEMLKCRELLEANVKDAIVALQAYQYKLSDTLVTSKPVE